MLPAVIGTLLGGLLDYVNPRMKSLDWFAAWFYIPAALAWVDVFGIAGLAHALVPWAWVRWGLWIICLVVTGCLVNSLVTRKFPICRKLLTPITDEVTGLGGVDRQGLNERLLTCIGLAAGLSVFAVGAAAGVVAGLHAPMHALGLWIGNTIGVRWLGYPGA